MAQLPSWFAFSALIVLSFVSTRGATFGNLNQKINDSENETASYQDMFYYSRFMTTHTEFQFGMLILMTVLSIVILILMTWLLIYYQLLYTQDNQTDAVGVEYKRDPVSLTDLFIAAHKTEDIRISHKDMIFLLKNHRRFTRFVLTLGQIKICDVGSS